MCVFMRNTLSLTLTDQVYTHVHTRIWEHEDRYSQHSCQCRWCRTKHAGNTPPASAWVDWGSGGSGWTPSLLASGCGSGPSPSTAAGWWPTRSQRYWRTSGLEVGDGDRVRGKHGRVFGRVRREEARKVGRTGENSIYVSREYTDTQALDTLIWPDTSRADCLPHLKRKILQSLTPLGDVLL